VLTLWGLSNFFCQIFPHAYSSKFSPIKILHHTVANWKTSWCISLSKNRGMFRLQSWQKLVNPNFANFGNLWVAISGNFIKLPYLAALQSCHYWQLHKAAICGNYICCQIWQQWSANFGKSLEIIIFHILAIIGTLSCFKKCLSQATFQNWHKFPYPFIATF